MPVDRIQWNSPFSELPAWLCPTCKKGHLKRTSDSISVIETGPSKKLKTDDDWDPDWTEERVSGFLYCDNIECGEVSSISGTSGWAYTIDEDVDGTPFETLATTFKVKSVFPGPDMFVLPEKCPRSVSDRLKEGFLLFWSDHDSCANKFRIAIEAFLTDRKIAKFTKAVAGKPRRRLTLHARIEKYRSQDTDAADHLEAIKWLGNYGSHEDAVLGVEDVFIAADLLEHVLNITYNKHVNTLDIAKKINRKKGPIKFDS